jgi:hypothetical protein
VRTLKSALVVSAILLAGCAHPRIVRSYEELRTALKPADRIELTASSGVVSGAVESMSADSLTVASDAGRRDIPWATIARLEKQERLGRRSALIGLAIGAGSGAAIATFSDCRAGENSCTGTRVGGTVGTAVVGMGIGAVAGMAPRTTLIYVSQNRVDVPPAANDRR